MATVYNKFVTLRLLFRMGLFNFLLKSTSLWSRLFALIVYTVFLTYVKVKEENGEGLLKSACIEMSAFLEISDQAPFSLFRFTTVPISILVF